MKKKSIIISSISIVLIIIIGSLFVQRRTIIKPLKSSEKKVQVVVNKNENLNDIVDKLSSEKKLRGKIFIKKYIAKKNISQKTVAGKYTFSNKISLNNFLLDLNKGIFDETPVRVTIPEGYSIEQIGNKLEQQGIIKKEDFIETVKKYKTPSYIKKDSKRKYSLEGYLFPDTYEFFKGMEGKVIVDKMLSRFQYVISQIEKEKNLKIDENDMDNIINMASVIEKEAQKSIERDKISSVFYNRLEKNMKLESCATVLYALGQHKNKLYYKDLKTKSDYNTYLHKGLPIGPICSPGKNSIVAALKPEKTNYLYFVSKNDGTHFFTNNYNEFLKVKKETQGD
ncbi:endolytic transglycosylase MltG [Clostridium niameyense]|uniref:Endolytic murein transglycosylase n=1 Tax=Clostridium niameyense TaxID=1622073 RepID=A0A6M0R881_9CLOT|nr:endolytic transglycosylase MltG [Clostridium niameyense]NEZ45977.1 endolytic transglycosylase MltG [Clostridium niameyense]